MLTWLLVGLVGLAALVAGALVLRGVGAPQRLGRLLAAAPQVSLGEALELAAGSPVYVRTAGRISSDEEFPDENDRPLVFRRTRVEVADGSGWHTIVDQREAVPFGIASRSGFIAADIDALGDGLVTIPRIADGRVADLPTDMAQATAGLAPSTPARLRIDQLSAVEHATVCGQPVLRDGTAVLTAGLGRPLIVTTLEPAAAMRVLATGARRRVAVATVLIGAGLLLVLVAGLALAMTSLAADPTATPTVAPSPVLIDPLDPRAGEGASTVGAPLLAFGFVIALGVLAALATYLYVRLTVRR